jgi:hypothetical protein
MTLLGGCLLHQHKYGEAEPILRKSLKVRAVKQADDWKTFNTRSLLGEALFGQKKYAEAERLLLQAYEGTKQRQETIPLNYQEIRLTEALERLVRFYEATDQKDKADTWRQKRTDAKTPQKKANR